MLILTSSCMLFVLILGNKKNRQISRLANQNIYVTKCVIAIMLLLSIPTMHRFNMMTSSNGDIFPRYWPFVRGNHRSPGNSPHKGQWRGALMFSLICACKHGWVTNGEPGDLRRHRAHYELIVMNTAISWRFLGTYSNNGVNTYIN